MPFMAFTLGQTIDLQSVVSAGLSGLALGVFVVAATGTLCITADLLLGGSEIAGAAASSTAGNAAVVPRSVAMADPRYAAIAPAPTVQVAASVIVSAILTPLLTGWMYRRVQRRRALAPPVGDRTPGVPNNPSRDLAGRDLHPVSH